MDDFHQLTIERHAHTDLLSRTWQLGGAMTAYNAMYVALAKGLGAPLITWDARLSRAHGHGATIRAIRLLQAVVWRTERRFNWRSKRASAKRGVLLELLSSKGNSRGARRTPANAEIRSMRHAS